MELLKPRSLKQHTRNEKSRLQNVYLEFFNHLARLIFHTHFEASARTFYAIFMTFSRDGLERLIGCDSRSGCLSKNDCTIFSNTQTEERSKKQEPTAANNE